MKSPAVLLMAYGSPARPEEIESYLAHIRGGDRPSPEATADLRRRYDAIGGRSPLLEITRSQAAELQRALEGAGIRAPVFVGMKHWHPFIRDVVTDIVAKGFPRILFSAHSLPKRILDEGDPYPQQLKETCTAIAEKLGTDRWSFAWQSAGSRGTWLGPSVLETLDELAGHGVKAGLSAPIGFTSDHLEILYDLDIGAASHARELGIRWGRVPLPNASPAFIAGLAGMV